MQFNAKTYKGILVAASFIFANMSYAFDMGNMMNPSKWMGDKKDKNRYDDRASGWCPLAMVLDAGQLVCRY